MSRGPNVAPANNDLEYRRTRLLEQSSTPFNRLIADGTSNFLDLPSVYDFNNERYRLRIDGTRTDPDDTTSFTDGQRDFEITPAAGETVQFYTAERPRYVVGYESSASFAFEGLSTVSANDTVRIGLTDRDESGNGENAAYFEITDSQNRIVLERSGTEVASDTFTFPEGYDFQSFYRAEIKYNAYDAGRWLFSLNFTDGDLPAGFRQVEETMGELTVDQEGATDEYNFHLFYEVDSPDGATSLSTGSLSYIVLGSSTPTLRVKGQRRAGLSYSGTGNYEPVLAMRKAPDRRNIFVDISKTSVTLNQGSGEVLIIAVDPSETDATGFATPAQHSEGNSVIQSTTNVTTFPDSTGSIVTSAANPGGYQVGFASTEGSQAVGGSRIADSQDRKRPIHNGDVAIALVKRDSAQSTTATVTVTTEQDW